MTTPVGCANSILQAWSTGDGRRLSAALDSAVAPCSGPAASAAEQERTELLQAVAAAMRKNCVRGGEQLDVCVGLLRHIATSNF